MLKEKDEKILSLESENAGFKNKNEEQKFEITGIVSEITGLESEITGL